MDVTYSFGRWLRARRRALDLTQTALAERAFCSTQTIKKIESDQRRPSRELAQSLAEALSLPDDKVEPFIEAARGLRPVDQLQVEPIAPGTALPPGRPESPTNLPSPLTSLVNRVQAVADVSAMLVRDGVRLVTLLGPPGIGKTRLSIQCGEMVRGHFPAGVWFVDLSAVTDPALVLPAVATALNTPTSMRPTPEQISRTMGDGRFLLVLDNVEQVAAGAALDVVHLLRACPGLKVLATGRVRLDVSGEHEYPVPPLTLPPAQRLYRPEELLAYESVALLVARVRQHKPDFAIDDENAPAVARLCRLLEGIPLALELAAARARRQPVGQLVEALAGPSATDSLLALASSARDLPSRQRTLYGAILWSYSALTPAEQTTLCRLGVLAGAFDTAAAVASMPAEPGVTGIAALLESLADYNLLARERANDVPRWRLLEMIRAFALAHLSPDELAASRRRHAEHFHGRFQELLGDAAVRYQAEAYLAAVQPHHDDLLLALDWAVAHRDSRIAIGLCDTLAWYWELRGLHDEGLARVRPALALPVEGRPLARLFVLWGASSLEWQRHNFASAQTFAEEAESLVRGRGLDDQLPGLLDLLGRIQIEQGHYQRAWELLSENVALTRQRPDLRNPGMPLAQLGEVAWFSGRPGEAKALFEEALGYLSSIGPNLFSAIAYTDLAEIAMSTGNYPAARQAMQQALPHAATHIRRARCLLVTAAGWLLTRPASTAANATSAARFLGAEAGLQDQTGASLAPFQQQLAQARKELLEQRLSAGKRQTAWQDGYRWSLEQALDQAGRFLAGG